MSNLKLQIVALFLISFCLPSIQAQNAQTAEQLIAEAQQLRKQRTAESLRNAIGKYEQATAIWRGLNDTAKEAATLKTIGVIYQQLSELPRSNEILNQALALARSVGEKSVEAETLLALAFNLNQAGEPRRAIEFYQQSLAISREMNNRQLEVIAIASLGYAYEDLGDKQNALNYYNQALPILRAMNDAAGEAATLVNIGAVYFSLGDRQRGLDAFEQALPAMRASGDAVAEATTLNNLAAGYGKLGDRQRAINFFNQALALHQKIGDRIGEAVVLSNLAGVYDESGDRQKALEFYQRALTMQRELKVRNDEADTLADIGQVYLALRDFGQAFDYFSRTLPIQREIGDVFGEAKTLYLTAHAERGRGNLNEARTSIESAIQIVESVRASLVSPELRAAYLAQTQDFYRLQIELLMSLHEKQPDKNFAALALQTSERARARSLLDLLGESRADIRQGVDAALLERERDLQKRLNAKDAERKKAKTAAEADALDQEIRQITAQFQELQAEIRQKSPRYAALTQPQPVGLREIQTMLDADTILLEYSLGDERSFLWLVSQTDLKTFILPKRADIETAAREAHEKLKTAKTERDAPKALNNLSRLILAPAAESLADKRLAIVADGALQFVPFAALVSRPSSVVSGSSHRGLSVDKANDGRRTTDNGRFLIETNEIVMLPSASTLGALRDEARGRKAAPKTIAVLADPVFAADDPRIARGGNAPTGENAVGANLEKATRSAGLPNTWRRLLASSREAKTILSLVGDGEKKQAIGFEASKSTATNPELANYRIIHFATHGLLNSRQPELSGIVFSLLDEKGKPQDGFLRLHEIYNLRLPADLVVLSACQTALGKDIKGEGLIGVTRGFMYAGAQRVASSLWEVEDFATSELMKNFYQNMLGNKKLPPAAALRQAQIAMLKNKQFAAPFYWSAFTIQGEWQ